MSIITIPFLLSNKAYIVLLFNDVIPLSLVGVCSIYKRNDSMGWSHILPIMCEAYGLLPIPSSI